MTVAYLFDPVKQFVSRNGIPLAGGFLNVFIGESQEPASTYSDAAGTVINPRNIPIDSAGRALGVFVDDSKLYTLKAYNSGGQLQFSIYPVAPAKGGTSGGDSYYYPGDEFIHIDQDAREISLQNTKPIRGDEETIQMEDTEDAVILHVNPDIIGDEMHVVAGEHTSVDYDSDNNTYTVNAEYAGSDTVEIDSGGAIHGNYKGGYGIEIDGNVVKETHHKMISTNAVQYNYCKVFEFTWQRAYGRGLCVFTATNHDGNYVKFVLEMTRIITADYTIVRPYVVAASPSMVSGAFVERLEVHTKGDKLIGYLKLNGFLQSQFWLDWEGTSRAGEVVFTPQLTNETEGELTWIRSVLNSDVFYPQTNADNKFQKKLTAGDNINITSDGVISAEGGLPSASSVDSDKVLTVDSDGNPSWSNPPKKPVVRSNVAFSATSTTETTSTWTSPTISAPSGGNAMIMYSIYVQGPNLTESDTWDVKVNGSNWTTGIRGNFSSFVCMVPVSGVTFTVTGPKGINAPRISYVLFQEWS